MVNNKNKKKILTPRRISVHNFANPKLLQFCSWRLSKLCKDLSRQSAKRLTCFVATCSAPSWLQRRRNVLWSWILGIESRRPPPEAVGRRKAAHQKMTWPFPSTCKNDKLGIREPETSERRQQTLLEQSKCQYFIYFLSPLFTFLYLAADTVPVPGTTSMLDTGGPLFTHLSPSLCLSLALWKVFPIWTWCWWSATTPKPTSGTFCRLPSWRAAAGRAVPSWMTTLSSWEATVGAWYAHIPTKMHFDLKQKGLSVPFNPLRPIVEYYIIQINLEHKIFEGVTNQQTRFPWVPSMLARWR